MNRRTSRYRSLAAMGAGMLGVLSLAVTATPAMASSARGEHSETRKVFPTSATEDAAADTASLPLQRGRIGSVTGPWVDYVVLESSDSKDAKARGVNESPKLANAAGTAAVQDVTVENGVVVFPAGVDFTPELRLQAGPTTFPPAVAEPGSVGDPGYSPLVRLPNGIVLNAPQVANAGGDHDKLLARTSSTRGTRGVFTESAGFYDGKDVRYVSFEASDPVIAALENATYAPALNAAPTTGDAGESSARSGIAPFVNGQTGTDNPDRQGLTSALLGEGGPLNVVASLPKNDKYSPLWDVYATQWTAAAVQSGENTLQKDFSTIADLAEEGLVTGLGGAPWGAIGVIVTCPIISVG